MASNPLEVAMSAILFDIPVEVLKAAFDPMGRGMSLDECIIEDVVRAKVLPDINASSGRLMRIPLQRSWIEPTLSQPYGPYGSYNGGEIYRIPPEARDNRTITSAIKVAPGTMYGHHNGIGGGGAAPFGFGYQGNTVHNTMGAVLGSRTLIDGRAAGPFVELLNDNLIIVKPYHIGDGFLLTCTVAFDQEFTNLTQHAILPLSKLILVATKGVIFTKLILAIGANKLIAGQSLDAFMEIVRQYQTDGSYETYSAQLDTVRNAMLHDMSTFREILKYTL